MTFEELGPVPVAQVEPVPVLVSKEQLPEPQKPAKRSKKPLPAEGSIFLNSATSSELEKLPGVGPATAAKILAYRQKRGKFKSIDQLLAVKGIGPKKLKAMRKYLRL